MDWECECKNEELASMIIVYQEHIDQLEVENDKLKKEVVFLRQQLEYKTLGLPNDEEATSSDVLRKRHKL